MRNHQAAAASPSGDLARRRSLTVLVPLLALTAAAAAAPTGARAAACPAATPATEDLLVTWGVDDGRTSLTRRGRPDHHDVFGQDAGVSAAFADGLVRQDAHEQPFVRTSPTRSGSRRVTLCAENGRRATLPTLRHGYRLGGVSVSGRYVAWRVTRNTTGVLNVGRVVRGRARAVRRTPTAPTLGGSAIDGRIQVTSRGDATWALYPARRVDLLRDVWVWPRGGPVRAIRRAKGSPQPLAVQFLDDQHVVLDDSTEPVRFRPATPGRCPRLVAGAWKPLAGWNAADAGGASGVGDAGDGWDRTLVCDPVSGRYRRILVSRGDEVPGGGTNDRITRLAKAGPWLLIERLTTERSLGSQTFATTVELQNSSDGTVRTVPGGFAGTGVPAPAPSPGDPSTAPAPVGATLRPGALAWTTPVQPAAAPAARSTVTLADATGTHDVGLATSTPAFVDGTLSWDDGQTPAAAAVSPDATWDLGYARF